jgi:SAM-dependent methyltransferase
LNEATRVPSETVGVATCPLCGGPAASAIKGVPDARGAEWKGDWRYLKCAKGACATVWLSPRPINLAALYDGYFTHGAPAPTRDSWAKRLLFVWTRFAARRRYFFGKPGDWGARMLEVGCGNGTNLVRLASAGWRVSGQDFDAAAIARARTLGVAPPQELFAGALEDMPSCEPFDAVLLSHVLEHVTDPGALLRACRDRLRPGGRLVVLTPNPRALGLRIFGRYWPSLHAPFHVLFLSPPTLARLARESGYDVEASFSDESVSGPAVQEALTRTFGAFAARLMKLPVLFALLAANRFLASGGDETILVAQREG